MVDAGRSRNPARVWAPLAERVDLVLPGGGDVALHRGEHGWWEADTDLAAGTDYAFRLDGGEPIPDPRSAWQPAGIHGTSRVVDHAVFEWSDRDWTGFGLGGAVLYELHVGTFTPEGTFDAAIDRLGHLADLGVDAVEVMPVNAFPGRHGWGYDGVGLYAVHDPCGGPDALKRFVDACHGRGIGVVLDVVYNHLGPDGNYLDRFGPYFTDRYGTPWGQAVNLDGPGSDEVRRFLIGNALQWLADYHVDALRLDAVHALFDTSALHFLEELTVEVEALADRLGRRLHLIAESDLNDPKLVRPREVGGYGLDAMWSDDLHHAVHAALTGERDGWYGDFGSLADVAYALRHGFVYDGRHSAYRGRRHGRPATGVPGRAFVGYLQNHDQIGNRARGERLHHLAGVDRTLVGAALVLLAPQTPMLFQGEEWAASSPFPYFADHEDPKLAAAVRRGRREEFAAFGWAPEDVADPQDPATFASAKLDWDERDRDPHRRVLDWYRSLIALRKREPDLRSGRFEAVQTRFDEDARWLVVERGRITLAANLADRPQAVLIGGDRSGELLLASWAQVDDRLAVLDALPPTSVAILARRG